ncbi:aldose epimerase family protein [Rubripirellula amarantea]|nr:aldose epimerase family protein [Rubripirellula amarantea]
MKIDKQSFGQTPDGQAVTRYTLTNSAGNSVQVMTWGASLLEVRVPDRLGNLENVNCVFDSLAPYLTKHPYFGSTVGRFCNRIGNAQFSIDGTQYSLTVNHGKHQLHGGIKNFAFKNWESESYQDESGGGVRFTLVSPDGDEGFPGEVSVTTDYHWNDANELAIKFTATTDAPTHVNFTNHSYWNLAGVGSGTMLDHLLTIEADQVLDVDGDLIPTGKFNDVEGTPFDFREPTAIGKRNDQLPATKGYDHCLVVRGEAGNLRSAARVVDPQSGRVMEVETTQPGMQLYAAGNLPGGDKSAGFGPHDAFCLETQHFPDAPNQPSFASTLLKPGEELEEVTVHRFLVD